jgi:4-deoxy-L-threo-5-hexosulose-uronate ketol-isomerase
MQIRYAVGKEQYQRMTTQELRRHFLVENLFLPGRAEFLYWETERTVLGGIIPTGVPLILDNDPALASDYFCERRETGVFNLGGPGEVIVDGQRLPLGIRDAVYIGRGSREVSFLSSDEANPARYYLISYPAHAAHPTRLIPRASANRVDLGASATANERTIFQYIHEAGAPSCQLVTGMTQLATGSIWNTMPPHTHLRRSEVYLYFDLPENAAVFHFMGTGDETRHLVIRGGQAVLSPSWSIHCGCATEAYAFIWAMGGENQKFTDMDGIKISELK